MKIARAWLDMKITEKKFKQRRKKEKGEAFKKIIEEQFQVDKKSFYQRLRCLSSQAVQAGGRLLVLPACALMFEKRLNFRKALGDNVPRIVALGKFHVRKRTNTDTALILRDWKAIDVPAHKILWTGLDGERFSIKAAISSTMRYGEEEENDKMKPDEDAPVLLLDMGHQRYPGHYLSALRTVWKSQRHSRRAVVILSSWHYRACSL